MSTKVRVLDTSSIRLEGKGSPIRLVIVLVDDDYKNSALNMDRISKFLDLKGPRAFVIRKQSEVVEFNLEESV